MDWSLPGSSVHGIFQARVLLYILNFYINKGIIIYNQKNKLFKEILVQIKEWVKLWVLNLKGTIYKVEPNNCRYFFRLDFTMATIFRNSTRVSYRRWWGGQCLRKIKYRVEHFLNVCSRNLQILCHHMNSKGQKHISSQLSFEGVSGGYGTQASWRARKACGLKRTKTPKHRSFNKISQQQWDKLFILKM